MVQGGYVAQSHSTQLSVTKKSNVLDKKKSNVLDAGTKTKPKTESQQQHNSESNNNNEDDNDSPVAVPQLPALTVSSFAIAFFY